MLDQPLFAAVKARLADVPGIENMSVSNIAGRIQFGMDGKIAAVDENASDADIDTAIRTTFGGRTTPLPPAPTIAPAAAPVATTKATTVTTPAPGSFAASLKAMMDEAKSGLAQAQATGRARVQEAVGKFSDATVATGKVSESMAQQIEDAASSALADLGQISNDLG